MDHTLRSSISATLNILSTTNFDSYLGFPILNQRKSVVHFSSMIDKIKKRLSGWKSRNLSLAGRVTLPQSSLLSILAYIMQITPLPASACKDIENLCQYFIWGSTHDRRKVHLIFWEDICKPKDKVLGLGFRNVYLLNKCYILKLSWQLIVDRDAL